MQAWLSQKLWVRSQIREALGFDGEILFGEHHLSHAASAFFPSPYEDAAVLTADGVGEWATTTVGVGHDLDLEISHEIRYPHSLGLLYSAFTAYLGFEVNEGEYKVMGMAAYGRPTCVDKVRQLIDPRDDGSYRAQPATIWRTTTACVDRSGRSSTCFGPPRDTGRRSDQGYADIAASIQARHRRRVLGLARAHGTERQ